MRTIEISGFRFSAVLALTIVFLSPAVNAQGSFGGSAGR